MTRQRISLTVHRRTFLGTLTGGLLASPLAAAAQQAPKVYKVGYMTVVSRQSGEGPLLIFLQALGDLGLVQGRNLHFEWRFADGNVERLPEFAKELVRLN